MNCKIPPLIWLFGGEDVSQELIQETLKTEIKIEITLNGLEWLPALSFHYHELKIERLAFVSGFGEGLDEEAKKAAWLSEEVHVVPEVEPTPEEILKKQDEEQKKVLEEAEELLNLSKRHGMKMYVFG